MDEIAVRRGLAVVAAEQADHAVEEAVLLAERLLDPLVQLLVLDEDRHRRRRQHAAERHPGQGANVGDRGVAGLGVLCRRGAHRCSRCSRYRGTVSGRIAGATAGSMPAVTLDRVLDSAGRAAAR